MTLRRLGRVSTEDHSLLKREIIDLITQQIEALRKATFLSMTTKEWKDYDNRPDECFACS